MSHALTGSNRVAAVAVFAVGLALVVLSGTMALFFGKMIGSGSMSAAGILVILLKVVLPFVIYAAWNQKARVLFWASVVALGLTCFCSLTTSYGYGVAQRDVGARALNSEREIRAQLAALPTHRPAATVEPLLKAAKKKDKPALESEFNTAQLADKLRTQLEKLPKVPTAESQIQSIAEEMGLAPGFVRAVLVGGLAITLDLGEILAFYGAAVLWRRREVEQEEVSAEPKEPETAEPVAEPAKADVAAPVRRRVTLSSWLASYVAAARAPITAADAYGEYLVDFKKNRRRVITRLEFGRALDIAAKEAGLARRSEGDRLVYQAA